jgi:large subunit ribosomal protein L15
MELHKLGQNGNTAKNRKRVGRGPGSGTGKTSGRGHKGQGARSGHSQRPGFEGGQMPLIRRLPKRGFKKPNRVEYAILNVGDLNKFEDGTTVDVGALREARIVRQVRDGVKVLGDGTLERKLTVVASAFTKSAREKIEAAGGTCEIAPFKSGA